MKVIMQEKKGEGEGGEGGEGGGGGCRDNGGFPQEGLKQQKVAPPPDIITTRRSAPAAAVDPDVELQHSKHGGVMDTGRIRPSLVVYACIAGSMAVFMVAVAVVRGLAAPPVAAAGCKSGPSCVASARWCDGVRDCCDGEDESHCFRLHGAEARLQSFWAARRRWIPVCAEAWDDSYGEAACEQLGYRRRDYVSFNRSGGGGGGGDGDSPASGGFLKLKPGATPYSSLQAQLAHSQFCSAGAVTLRCVECGRPSVAPGRGAAVGGAWPWQVSLQVNSQHLCGGAIISPVWILSAAHCFQGCYENPALWRVFAGDVSLSRMSDAKMVAKIHNHGGFDPATRDNDVALLRLARPLTFGSTVAAVCLPNVGQSFGPESDAWVTGWGDVSQSEAADLLGQTQVSLYGGDACRQASGRTPTDATMCAGILEGGVDACQGDSGGPLVVSQGNAWWLAGDTSRGVGCAPKSNAGVYGNVTHFADWIRKTMKLL